MNYALLFAGGRGTRMGNCSIPKQFIEIHGKPVIIHAIRCFEECEEVDRICVVCIEEWCDHLSNLICSEGLRKVEWVVKGASTGQRSIYNGLKVISENSLSPKKDIVMISDGVRPIVRKSIIRDSIQTVLQYGSAVVVCPSYETIVETDEYDRIIRISDGKRLFLTKAPQSFYLNDIMNAHSKAMAENNFNYSNSAELMSRYGYSLHTILDKPDNIKITTPFDIRLMEMILGEHAE